MVVVLLRFKWRFSFVPPSHLLIAHHFGISRDEKCQAAGDGIEGEEDYAAGGMGGMAGEEGAAGAQAGIGGGDLPGGGEVEQGGGEGVDERGDGGAEAGAALGVVFLFVMPLDGEAVVLAVVNGCDHV